MGRDGRAYQVLPWNHRAWHAGSPANDMFISIELTEPSTIAYTGIAANYIDNNPTETKAFVVEVYNHSVQFAAYICKKYGFNPLDSTQLLSHREGARRGWATNHADVEHLWSKYGLSMNQFRIDVNKALGNITEASTGKTRIAGISSATIEEMRSYIKLVNPNIAQSVIDMIPYYISEGKVEGIRGDIAFAQSCLETGNFKFEGSAVTLDQNNFCGLGVTANGMKGNGFDTPQLGIRAQIQHLKAYADKEPLVNTCIDPRFAFVQRGCAEYVVYLGIQENPSHVGWAAGAGYGSQILNILSKITGSENVGGSDKIGNSEEEISGTIVRVTVDSLNIRSGPGTGYAVVGKISDKGAYTIIAISENWGKLKSDLGWICIDYTNYQGNIGSIGPKLPYAVKIIVEDLIVRSGPGTSYRKVGIITDKGTYTIIDFSSNWGKLKSGLGWICLDYTNLA